MRRIAGRLLALAAVVVVVAGLPLSGAGAQNSGDWPTYLNNVARTGFNSAETLITPSTAPNLANLWTDTAGGAVYAEPVQVDGVVYYGSWDGYEHAVDAATGTQLWSAFLGQFNNTKCDPSTMGPSSTPTVGTITVNGTATQAVFLGGGDGNLYALNASTGAVIWKIQLGPKTNPNFFLFSSPLYYNGSLYEGLSSCGNGQVRGGIVQLDAVTGTVQHTLYTAPSGCFGGSVWGSPTVDAATGDIYFGTAEGGGPRCTEPLTVSLVETDSSLNLLSSWQVPASQQPNKDSDFGSTPTLFTATISGVVHQMVGLPNKNGIYYAFDRSAISNGPLWQRRISGGGSCPECGHGDISPSAWDGSHLFVGGETTTINGVACAGSIRELGPSTGKVAWADCLQSGPVLGAVTAVPGVAFADAGNTAYAVATSTGAILWSYQDTNSGSTFWGAPTISNGQAYFGNQDGNLYAFRG
jgi:outer membrane protein assembly factor BamB